MFRQAHLKLTALYLLIIMLISFSFSIAIYRTAEYEIKLHADTHRIIAAQIGGNISDIETLYPSNDDEIRRRVIANLVVINLAILIIAGCAGYFLGAKTLSPIKKMIEEQDRFVADASHEFRTPLTALRTSIEVSLRDKKVLGYTRRLLNINLKDVVSLQKLTDTLLELAKMQKPGVSNVFAPVFVAEIIEEAVSSLSLSVGSERIKIKKSMGNSLVFGDRDALTEMLVALLDNAVKYSGIKNKIYVSAKKEAGKIKIAIKDSGIGIDDKDMAHIFDRFYRVDSARSASGGAGGFGLGLAIAKRIVASHNGSIEVVSKVGKGSTFTVILPLQS